MANSKAALLPFMFRSTLAMELSLPLKHLDIRCLDLLKVTDFSNTKMKGSVNRFTLKSDHQITQPHEDYNIVENEELCLS